MRNTSLQFLTKWLLWLVFTTIFLACNDENQEDFLFRNVPPSESGIHFSNDITETEDFNILNFHYIYNGGGVGVGDFNKDGLPDLVFSGNQVPSKIYLNQDNLKFKDITETSNFKTKGWATGISIIDINADGWQDIYISIGGYQCDGNCKNQLFIHQGLDENNIPKFKEMAADYGLADGLYTQQAAFFDYDLDGDLDVYLLHNVIDKRDKNAPSKKHFINEKSRDRLLRNDLPPSPLKGGQAPAQSLTTKDLKRANSPFRGLGGKFTDISDSLGITHRGYGLGITINDFNNDNLPDIYIANDFLSDDLMYLNLGNKNGQHLGFEEVSKKYLKHTSYNSMGVDVADINNDALPDIFVLDMLPEYNERQKTMLGFMNYNKFLLTLRQDYSPQFIRNTLQIHNGFLDSEMLPFSEVGYLAGVYNTDWSWTPLFADFDNDGDKDLFVTNGYGKDITDLDFINYSQTRNPFGTKESQQKELFEVVQKMESVTMPNYIFENEGALKFQNQQNNWLKKENSISNGAVYADLDNDGDLDLVVNNIDEPAYILENQLNKNTSNNYLKIKLEGFVKNPAGIGSKIEIWTKGERQVQYQSPVRGYLSSVEDLIHFGLAGAEKVDSVKVIWQDGKTEVLKNIAANQVLEIRYSKSLRFGISTASMDSKYSKSQRFGISKLIEHKHQENQHIDFDAQPLLLHQHSRQGPCLAAANIDGKPGDELFIGGAKGYPSQIFYQTDNGNYEPQNLPGSEKYEDTDATFFDYDNDGDLDLYVVSGGVEFKEKAPEFEDRLYLNNGKGNFSKLEIRLPKNSGSCVVPNDFNKDGKTELFVGGRVVPRKYPQTPPSSLLIHNPSADGLLDYANKLAHPLEATGMVTDAVWSDVDGNGWDDLIVVGEWMPITIFKNNQGHFNIKDTIQIPNSKGLWNCISKGDFDNDGDEDFVLGNIGANARLEATPSEPLTIYAKDFDQNGSPDPFIGQYYLNKNGERKSYPIHARDDVVRQVPKIKNRFVKYEEFGKATFSEVLQKDLTEDDFLFANHLTSSYLENIGNSDFKLKSLPQAVQLAPIQDMLIDDFDNDGSLDVLLSGNDFSSEKNNGWYDAFNGLLLKGTGNGNFEVIPNQESGFFVPGDGRDIVKMTDKNGNKIIVVGQNDNVIAKFIWQIENDKPAK